MATPSGTRRSGSLLLGTQHRAPGAGEEAGLDEEVHGFGLGDRLAVEALDREPLRTPRPNVSHERGERGSQPAVLGVAEWDEGAPAALDEERRLAVEEDHPGSCNSGCASTRASRPRQ